MCLVLDLDETLVHSSFKPTQKPDYIIPVEIDGTIHKVYVCKRPGVDEFMRRMGEVFEIVVYTASLSKYADPLLDQVLLQYLSLKSKTLKEMSLNSPADSPNQPNPIEDFSPSRKSTIDLPHPCPHTYTHACTHICARGCVPTHAHTTALSLLAIRMCKVCCAVRLCTCVRIIPFQLDIHNTIGYRLFREHCVLHEGSYVKV